MKYCETCGRDLSLTKHHLVPKDMHNKKWCRKIFTIKEMNTKIAMVCQPCHSAFHKFISNKDMAKTYNSVEKLKEHPKVSKFIEWVSKNENRKFKH